MFMSGVLGTATKSSPTNLTFPGTLGTALLAPVTSVSHVSFNAFLRGVSRETLIFSVWELVTMSVRRPLRPFWRPF